MDRRLIKGVKKFCDIFIDAREKEVNEADCVTRIIKFLEEVLDYDVFANITKEFQVKDRYVDLAIRVGNKVKFYIEAKAPSISLKESQIFQAESYASQSGIQWVILTNGCEWQLYHLVFGKRIEHSLMFNIDLSKDDIAMCVEKLSYLSRQSMQKGLIEKFRQKQTSLNSESIVRALFHEDTIRAIKREIRRKVNVSLTEDDIVDGLKRILSEKVIADHCELTRIRRKRKMNNKIENKEPAPQVFGVATNPKVMSGQA